MKLTSFDKLIERTCGSIKNVRLWCEPDQKPGGSTGNSSMAPDAAEIQLKSPNWLFGQRKYEESSPGSKGVSHEVAVCTTEDNIKIDGFCDLNKLSSSENFNDEEIFQ
ncbi:unnamed protein product, partial [Citrullus colocynthis]